VWDDPSFKSAQGTNVQLYPLNNGTNQKWVFTSIGNGYYTIMNDYNGLLLDDPAFSTTSGTPLIQYSSNGGNNQHWLVTPSGTGYILTNQYSGLKVDASGNTQGTDIVQATGNGSSGQTWTIH
jgi:Ricin-type beta-trefoil lectin domain-like